MLYFGFSVYYKRTSQEGFVDYQLLTCRNYSKNWAFFIDRGKVGLTLANKVGKIASRTNSVITGVQALDDYYNKKYYTCTARLAVNGAIWLIAWGCGPFGPVINSGLGMIEGVYGDQFYNYIENTFDK